MPEDTEQGMMLNVNRAALRLLLDSVDSRLKNWSGGDPDEQVQLMEMKTVLYSAMLEFTLSLK